MELSTELGGAEGVTFALKRSFALAPSPDENGGVCGTDLSCSVANLN